MKRKLVLESLEDRRVLSLVPVGTDGTPFPGFDPANAGDEMVELQRPTGMARPAAGMRFLPVTSSAGPEHVAIEIEDVPERPLPIESHHFISVLRPIPETMPPAEGGMGSGGHQGEGEPGLPEGMRPDIPERFRAGMARFFLNKDESALRYRLRIPHLAGVDSATIRLGKPGSDGPAVATLFDLNVGELDGISVRGKLTDDDISANEEFGFDGTLESLVAAMRDKEAYVEVATQEGAALRGGIRPLGWRPWHNPLNRMDVTGDKNVSPQDALAVINDLNENGARLVEAPPLEGLPPDQMFTDVTGDNIVSPRDALDLVQFLSDKAGELLKGVDVTPETVSETVNELVDALEIDPADFPDMDYSQLLNEVLPDDTDQIEDLVDRVADGLQQEYEQHYSQLIGDDGSQSLIEIDWEALYQQYADELRQATEAFGGLGSGLDQMMDELRGAMDALDGGRPPAQP